MELFFNLIVEKVLEKFVNVLVFSKFVEEKKQLIFVEDLEKFMGLKFVVGIIYGYQQIGIVFRVGVDKIIIVWYVVRVIRGMYNYM